jgi:hypothetical protein
MMKCFKHLSDMNSHQHSRNYSVCNNNRFRMHLSDMRGAAVKLTTDNYFVGVCFAVPFFHCRKHWRFPCFCLSAHNTELLLSTKSVLFVGPHLDGCFETSTQHVVNTKFCSEDIHIVKILCNEWACLPYK